MSDESLFREVDEEVRQEQFQKLWARFGNLIIAVCFIVIAGVAGFKGWQYWQEKQAQEAGASFFTSLQLAQTGKTDDALKQLEAIDHKGFAVLARMRTANLLGSQGKTDDAVKIYDAVAADSSVDAALRDLARMRAAVALADKAPPADLEARLKPFDAAGNSWRHAAREIMAGALWRSGDAMAADKKVQEILADPETPTTIRQRATVLAELLAPQLATK